MSRSVFAIVVLFLMLPFTVNAAVLYFDPSDGAYGPGDSFSALVKLDVNTGCVNTVEGVINFPRDKMVLESFMTGESIISIWLEKPSDDDLIEINRKGELRFSGGIPGGYCGKIPGDPGESNILARLIFRLPRFAVSEDNINTLNISFTDNTRVLLNDGQGTADMVITKPAVINLLSERAAPDFDWQKLIARDTIPPEPFIIELRQRDDMFEGRYYAIFNTVDKQTGVDHYEILEITPNQEAGIRQKLSWWDKLRDRKTIIPKWKTTAMPYVLFDQSLNSIIKVKAVDKAGNERLVEYIPPREAKLAIEEPVFTPAILSLLIIGGLSFIAVIIILLFIFHKRRAKG